jgi:hypothetical protein
MKIYGECTLRKATNKHLEYLKRIVVPLQKRLRESALMLHFSTLPVLYGLAFAGKTGNRYG